MNVGGIKCSLPLDRFGACAFTRKLLVLRSPHVGGAESCQMPLLKYSKVAGLYGWPNCEKTPFLWFAGSGGQIIDSSWAPGNVILRKAEAASIRIQPSGTGLGLRHLSQHCPETVG